MPASSIRIADVTVLLMSPVFAIGDGGAPISDRSEGAAGSSLLAGGGRIIGNAGTVVGGVLAIDLEEATGPALEALVV